MTQHARLRAAIAAFTLMLFAACAAPAGEAVATRIGAAHADIVQQVNYRAANSLDGDVIDVYLRPGTTKAQALDFWCIVVIPAGGSAYYGDAVAVGIWFSTGEFLVPDTTCPAPSPQ